MSQTVFVHLLPKLFEPDELRGGVAVVIDVLRASTTIVHALAAGAKAVIPCEEVEEARRLAANLPGGECLLGGERNGVKIEGFDLDNSPLAYTRDIVADKTIIFTTTNGTRALARAKQAETILIGTFSNFQAIMNRLGGEQRPIHLICAGTCGVITSEDVMFAGNVAWSLQMRYARPSGLDPSEFRFGNDEAEISSRFFHSFAKSHETMFDALCHTCGGRNLLAAGLEADIRCAADMDLFNIVPQYNPETNTITQTV